MPTMPTFRTAASFLPRRHPRHDTQPEVPAEDMTPDQMALWTEACNLDGLATNPDLPAAERKAARAHYWHVVSQLAQVKLADDLISEVLDEEKHAEPTKPKLGDGEDLHDVDVVRDYISRTTDVEVLRRALDWAYQVVEAPVDLRSDVEDIQRLLGLIE